MNMPRKIRDTSAAQPAETLSPGELWDLGWAIFDIQFKQLERTGLSAYALLTATMLFAVFAGPLAVLGIGGAPLWMQAVFGALLSLYVAALALAVLASLAVIYTPEGHRPNKVLREDDRSEGSSLHKESDSTEASGYSAIGFLHYSHLAAFTDARALLRRLSATTVEGRSRELLDQVIVLAKVVDRKAEQIRRAVRRTRMGLVFLVGLIIWRFVMANVTS